MTLPLIFRKILIGEGFKNKSAKVLIKGSFEVIK